MISPREMTAFFAGALQSAEYIPNHAKTEVMVKMGRDLGVNRDDVIQILKDLDGSLEFLVKRAQEEVKKGKKDIGSKDNKYI